MHEKLFPAERLLAQDTGLDEIGDAAAVQLACFNSASAARVVMHRFRVIPHHLPMQKAGLSRRVLIYIDFCETPDPAWTHSWT